MYSVKEMFLSLQGEGAQAGRTMVFLRFAGCNLWSGREEDRATAVCSFCDTDFVGTDGQNGSKFVDAEAVVAAAERLWTAGDGPKWVVATGGEPTLQLDVALVDAFHRAGWLMAIETNGTKPVPPGVDWVCVSPKADAEVVQTAGDELKLVYPQGLNRPEDFAEMNFSHRFLQPCDGAELAENTRAAVAYCLAHPEWRLSVQTHKMVGID